MKSLAAGAEGHAGLLVTLVIVDLLRSSKFDQGVPSPSSLIPPTISGVVPEKGGSRSMWNHPLLAQAQRGAVCAFAGFVIALGLGAPAAAHASGKTITCPSGEKRVAIDVRQLANLCPSPPLFDPLAGWISMAPKVGIDAIPFRKALTAVAETNQLLMGIAERWNRCELTRKEYDSGVPQVLARMKADAAELEKLKQEAISAGRLANPKRLAERIAAFDADLHSFARLAGREVVLDRIDAQARAMQLQAEGHLEAARGVLAEALTRSEKALGSDHSEVAILASNLGGTLQALGDLQGAERNVRRALAIEEKVFGPEHRSVAIDCNALSQILFSKIDREGAVAYGRRALAIGEKTLDPYDPYLALFSYNLSLILVATGGDVGEQERLARRALSIEKRAFGSEVPEVATMSSLLGMIRRSQGFSKEALPLFEEAHRILAATYGAESREAQDAARQIEITRGMKDKG